MTPQERLESLYSRRDFLNRCGMGFGALGLGALIGPQIAAGSGVSSGRTISNLHPRSPHFHAKAKRVIHIFANGGPSQVDTFDPKPMLRKWHGKLLPNTLKTERLTGAATLVVTPTGETILIGMGLPGDRDPSGINKLIREGVGTTKIDHLVITHFERDHYGGATAALGAMRE